MIRENSRSGFTGFALDAVAFVGQLPKGQVSRIAGDQLLCCATSIGAKFDFLRGE